MSNTQTPSQTPILIVVIGLVVWTGFQTVQLYQERQAAIAAQANQAPLIANAKKMRAQLDVIAAKTKRLADQGNANAQLIVQQLAKNGININPDAPASATAK
jgi:predicted negative regulator of RcsB-dependent stress response